MQPSWFSLAFIPSYALISGVLHADKASASYLAVCEPPRGADNDDDDDDDEENDDETRHQDIRTGTHRRSSRAWMICDERCSPSVT
jgi:hypothetical protein